MLPTGHITDQVVVEGKPVQITICDVANIAAFARAEDLQIRGDESPESLNHNAPFLARVKELRGKAAQLVGMCDDWEKVDQQSPFLPFVVLLSKPTTPGCHVQSRLFLGQECHTAMAGTGAICHAACSRIRGSVVNQFLTAEGRGESTFNIQHPIGTMPVVVKTKNEKDDIPTFETLSFIRTARRILDGRLCVPDNVKDCVEDGTSAKQATSTAKPPTTVDFAKFVANVRSEDLPSSVTDKLRILLLDYLGVAIGASSLAESTESIVNGIQKLNAGGNATAFRHGQTWSPPFAALINGALAHSLDFDDTHADGALHPGASVVSAALIEGEANSTASTADVIAALAVGYEIACRLGVGMSLGAYSQGFHNTSTAGIFGAVAVIAKLRKLDASVIENAFGLAVSMASGTMQFLANGSWNKRLHPGFAAHNAFICVALAESGVHGASEPIEGKWGLLKAFANQTTGGVPAPLNEHWELLKTAVKPYPACRMTHNPIEVANLLAQKRRDGVKQITVRLAKPCFPVVGEPNPNKVHPVTTVDAQFSLYFQTATAWLKGSALGWKAYGLLEDEDVRNLSDKIVVEPREDYEPLETSLRVEYDDGSAVEEHSREPSGEPGNPMKWEAEVTKFKSLTVDILGAENARQVCDIVEHFEQNDVSSLMALVK
jgi:2-methylcitrate dehydratase PrpD